MQDRSGISRAAHVEAAPDDQLGVVAPDVHSAPLSVRLVLRGVMSGVACSDCAERSEVAVCERTDTEFTRRGEAAEACAVSVPLEALPALASDVTGVNHPAHPLRLALGRRLAGVRRCVTG
ncbi:hypothetical protein JCM4814A_28240 [Streptomyces phaeofaciens JCM 4814]|uniref:Uncharacterized protein n=1 Tax=Streptomyces phaeofaciens TaxID=68254 RepID=A0A918LRH2_9ACTN|nr:hypothetical protein GCM10010226_13580 [Streptomyces phaeofaciens]